MIALMGALAAPCAHAAADAPMMVASANTTPRFMSLDSARGPMAGATIQRAMPQASRSDASAMRSGFIRIDRDKMVTIQRQVPRTNVARRDEPVTVTRPQDAAVLDLFGDDSTVPEAAPALSSLGRVSHAWPIAQSITQRLTSMFGPRKDPFHGKASFHGGVDIAAAPGTNVLASADGVVTKVENGARYGKYVSVKHRDGTESSYGHLSAQNVRVGQNVRQGQKLGELGSTGRSTGPHLDYRIKKNGNLFNPMTVLKQPGTPSTARVANNNSHVSTINGVRIIR